MPTMSSPTPDATPTTKGKLALAGALTGTAEAPRLNTGATTALTNASESTSSTGYVDLTTVGPSVTVTVNANGLALVSLHAGMSHGSANGLIFMGFALSGANTAAASDAYALMYQTYTAGSSMQMGTTFLLTGLTAGSTTFTAKYRVNAATGSTSGRRIAVVPL